MSKETEQKETEQKQKRNSELKPVIIRTYSAGVHFGYLVRHEGTEVELADSRRIWYWAGANTLNEIATKGLDVAKSKVSEPANITLTQAIEILQVTPEAEKIIQEAKWAQ